MYTSSTIMNFILEGKICFTETEWKCKTSLVGQTYTKNFNLQFNIFLKNEQNNFLSQL